MLTLTDIIREEALQEGELLGIKKGELKGKIEGKIEGKQNSLIRQMTKKFGLTEQEIALIQSCNDQDKLDMALEEILFANTKEEVLRYLE